MSRDEIMRRWYNSVESPFTGAANYDTGDTNYDTYETSIADSEDWKSSEESIGDETQNNMLLKELMAVRILFNRDNKCPVISLSDCNYYVVGCMGRHNIVAVCLPFGEYGINSAAAVVLNMKRSYTGIEFCLLIGIGGGVPSK